MCLFFMLNPIILIFYESQQSDFYLNYSKLLEFFSLLSYDLLELFLALYFDSSQPNPTVFSSVLVPPMVTNTQSNTHWFANAFLPPVH